jgi:hypothetical protein
MRRNLPGLLFAALAACAFLVAMPQRGKAQTYAYFTIPATASPTCLLASPAPPPAPAALLQITNTGGQTTTDTLTFYDENSANCNVNNTIWGPLPLGPGQTIVFGTFGIPLLHKLTYSINGLTSTTIGSVIVVTW